MQLSIPVQSLVRDDCGTVVTFLLRQKRDLAWPLTKLFLLQEKNETRMRHEDK